MPFFQLFFAVAFPLRLPPGFTRGLQENLPEASKICVWHADEEDVEARDKQVNSWFSDASGKPQKGADTVCMGLYYIKDIQKEGLGRMSP